MYAKFFKRFIDFMLSLMALIALSALLLFLTLIGAIAMKGNPFFVTTLIAFLNHFPNFSKAFLIDDFL